MHFQIFPPTLICHFGVALKEKSREREREREGSFNSSLYAIWNRLCFISHSDDFRRCNGAAAYLFYDQWHYVSVPSFGTSLARLLVLAIEFRAVQIWAAASFCCSHLSSFLCSLACLSSSRKVNSEYEREKNGIRRVNVSATNFLTIIDDPIFLEWIQLIFLPDFLFDRSCRTKKKQQPFLCPCKKNNRETYICTYDS